MLLAGEQECERSALVNAIGTSVFMLLLNPLCQTHILVYAFRNINLCLQESVSASALPWSMLLAHLFSYCC
jgi:hypothetical protein